MRVKNICLFLFIFYLAEAEADPKFVNVDGLAAAAGQALLDKELTSGKWWNDLVNYFNPPPAAAAAAPPPNLEPLEELLRQQLTMLGQIKLWQNVLPPSNILIN